MNIQRPMHRTSSARSLCGAFLLWLLLPASAYGEPHSSTDDHRCKNEAGLDVDAFVGQVNNRFSSTSRLKLLNFEEDEESNTDLFAGIYFNSIVRNGCYTFRGNEHQWELNIYGEADHSSRVFEAACEPDSSDPNNSRKCEPKADPKPGDFFKIVKESNTLEWLGGLQYIFATFNKDDQLGAYVRLQYGFIRAPETGDDLIDNHFFGIGLEHRERPFEGSYLEVGVGRTDLFAPGTRNNRRKVNAQLYYTPKSESKYSFFVETLLDSDFGPGSDDIEIYYGLAFSLDEIMKG